VKRWVGFGVIADNLINLGHALTPSLERGSISIPFTPTRSRGRA